MVLTHVGGSGGGGGRGWLADDVHTAMEMPPLQLLILLFTGERVKTTRRRERGRSRRCSKWGLEWS